MKTRIIKNNKKIVVVRIIYVKISVRASYSSYGSRYSSHITVLPF